MLRPLHLLPLLLLADAALACGPYYASPLLVLSGQSMSDKPEVIFHRELEALLATVQPTIKGQLVDTATGDLADLRAALADHANREMLVTGWARVRAAHSDNVTDEIPEEFQIYQRGVAAMFAGRIEEAIQHYEQVLALPPAQRHYRSTWAAYMLGALHKSPQQREASLTQVRELAAQGFVDTLGLATASLRRQADEEMARDAHADALQHCAEYRIAGGRHGCVLGFRDLAETVAFDPGQHRRAARLPLASQAVSLALTSGQRGWGAEAEAAQLAAVRSWVDAVAATSQASPMAGRLAWAAWQAGDDELAARWVLRAPASDPVAAWIDAKIALKGGELERAGASLERAISGLQATALPAHTHCGHHHRDPRKAVRVELGIVRIAQDRPAEALDLFLDGGDWMDAAWVGERLLSTAELRQVVDRRAPDVILQPWYRPNECEDCGSGFVPMLLGAEDIDATMEPALLRPLLGRRLVREGRLVDARPYLAPEARPHLDQVVADLAIGEDASRSDSDRGGALWRAAFTLKMQGWALSATELEPDHRVLGGWYPGTDTTQQRQEHAPESVLPPTADEGRRIAANAGRPERYHFVWTSTELAMRAMQLMPDDHPDLPQAACVTGNWMRNRNPDISWRTELALRNRAPDHPLTKAAAERSNWWGVQDDGSCGMPDGSPVPTSSCSTTPWMAPWWMGLFLASARRRRAT